MSRMVEDREFSRENIVTNGNKYMTGNGYMGCRGTLEEFGKEQLAALTLAGVYDQAGGKWREPVNAPNALFTRLRCNGERLGVLDTEPLSHRQELDLSAALHKRGTVYSISGGELAFTAERFVSMDQLHVLASRLCLVATADCRIELETGIDSEVWDINGPHLYGLQEQRTEGVHLCTAVTGELGLQVAVAEMTVYGFEALETAGEGARRFIAFDVKAGEVYEWFKYAAVYTELDCSDPDVLAMQNVRTAEAAGYGQLLAAHREAWAERWKRSDCLIEGDDAAQFALRYSIYQLLIIAPTGSEKVSIPARGCPDRYTKALYSGIRRCSCCLFSAQ